MTIHTDHATDSTLVSREDGAGHTVRGNLGNIDGEGAFHEKEKTVKSDVSI